MKIGSSEFKAKCLALLDQVEKTGEQVVILKRGHPIARLVPAFDHEAAIPQKALKRSVRIVGDWDLTEPVLPADSWDILSEGNK
jgi:prevent-host-death family protein